MSDARSRSGERDIQTHLQTNTLETRRCASSTKRLPLTAESLLDATHSNQSTPLWNSSKLISSDWHVHLKLTVDSAVFPQRWRVLPPP